MGAEVVGMDVGVWLFLSLPGWYLSAARYPLAPGAGLVGALAAVGLVALVLGIVTGAQRARVWAWRLGLSLGVSEGFVFVAGLLHGRIDASATWVAVTIFVLFQITIAAGLFARRRPARLAVGALTLFALSYAVMAADVAAASFTGTLE